MKSVMMAVFVTCSPTLGLAQASTAAATDTVIRFDVASRLWTWPYLLAHVGLNCRGGEVMAGTTTAPDTAAKGRERYCAGATIEMRNPTLMLRGARGVVRVRINRTPADSMRQPWR